ncbi:MAG: hypothetical protein K9L17_11435 [Clostridiales bacterium]|nr:hypothetical protein [Clostridiales bacterium]MCF8023294.1 hypothetical protein [Clostridiales bacterium]
MDKDKDKYKDKNEEKSPKKGGGRMAVSLREFPVIKGRDAEKFMEKEKKAEEMRDSLVDNFRKNPSSFRKSKRSKGIHLCKPE